MWLKEVLENYWIKAENLLAIRHLYRFQDVSLKCYKWQSSLNCYMQNIPAKAQYCWCFTEYRYKPFPIFSPFYSKGKKILCSSFQSWLLKEALRNQLLKAIFVVLHVNVSLKLWQKYFTVYWRGLALKHTVPVHTQIPIQFYLLTERHLLTVNYE